VAGCGALLAAVPGSSVVTVFAGLPEAAAPLTDEDRRRGHGDGQAAMKSRLGEDDKALHLLKAQSLRLPFLDDRYVRALQLAHPKVDKIAHALQGILEKTGARTILFPVGLFYQDRILVSDAALNLFTAMPGRRWIAYEDVLDDVKPGVLHARLVQFFTRGISLTPVGFPNTNAHRKATAASAYASQAPEPGAGKDAGKMAAPERYWLLSESVKHPPEATPR
jgi:hypothetical protein